VKFPRTIRRWNSLRAAGGDRSSAFALVAVLVIVMLLSMLVISLLFRFQAEDSAASASLSGEQAWVAAMSGVEEALRVLFTAAPGATDGVNPHGHGFMCWCELVTPDPKASAAFLAHVLGWTSNDQDMGAFTVTIASANGHPVASLWTQGADDAHPWKRARWYPYVQVNAIEPAAAQAKALGATLPCDIMPIPGVGRWQPTYDPTGCETALLEPSHCAPKGS